MDDTIDTMHQSWDTQDKGRRKHIMVNVHLLQINAPVHSTYVAIAKAAYTPVWLKLTPTFH